MKVIFNPPQKVGGTNILTLVKLQCHYDLKYKVNLKGIHNCSTYEGYPFYSNKKDLISILEGLPINENIFFCSHHYYWRESISNKNNYIWINMIREPVSSLISWYYYSTDIKSFGYNNVNYELKKRRNDGCGCEYLEFNDCIRQNMMRKDDNCSRYMTFQSQTLHFLDEDDDKILENAYHNAINGFLVVGLHEYYDESIILFEKLIPQIFIGVSEQHFNRRKSNVKANKSVQHNSKTKTSMNGAVSSDVRKFLESYNEKNVMEVKFYKLITRYFWRKYASLIPESQDPVV